MNTLTLGLLIYVIIQMIIGISLSKKMNSQSDFILAGRNLGYLLGSFTIFATWFGAESVVSAAGEVYESGLSAAGADPFGYGLALLITGGLIARRLWRGGYMTLGDFFKKQFGVRCEHIAVLLMLPGPVIWGGAQIKAFGQVVCASSDLPMEGAVIGAAVIVITYTLVGGLYASAVTDFIQGLVLILGLITLSWIVFNQSHFTWAEIPEERLHWIAPSSDQLWTGLERWGVALFSTLVALELLSRVLATRSETVAQNATLLAGGFYILIGLIPLSLGLIGPRVIPHLDDPEQIIPKLALRYLIWPDFIFPQFPFILFSGALISAILSTVDSVLISSSSILSHNIIVPFFRVKDDHKQVQITRLCIVLLGLIATGLSLTKGSIHSLIEYSASLGSSGLVVSFLFGLLTPWGGAKTAQLTLWSGIIFWALFEFISPNSAPYLSALACTGLIYIGGTFYFKEFKRVSS